MGKYRVVRLSMHSVWGQSMDSIYSDLSFALGEFLRPHWDLVSDSLTKTFGCPSEAAICPGAFINSLQDPPNSNQFDEPVLSSIPLALIKCLSELDPITKLVVLVDDYDNPFRYPFESPNERDKAQRFFRGMYSGILESDGDFKTCLMGVADRDGGLLGDMSRSVDGRYARYFGFTAEEVGQLLRDEFGMTHEEVENEIMKRHGIQQACPHFRMGAVQLVEPWSLLMYIQRKSKGGT
jgi:hypothetical protein